MMSLSHLILLLGPGPQSSLSHLWAMPLLLFPPWPWSSALPGQSEPPWSLADTNSNTPGPAATLFPVFNLHPAVGEAPEHSLTLTRPHPCQKPLVTTESRDKIPETAAGLPPSTSTGKFTAGLSQHRPLPEGLSRQLPPQSANTPTPPAL